MWLKNVRTPISEIAFNILNKKFCFTFCKTFYSIIVYLHEVLKLIWTVYIVSWSHRMICSTANLTHSSLDVWPLQQKALCWNGVWLWSSRSVHSIQRISVSCYCFALGELSGGMINLFLSIFPSKTITRVLFYYIQWCFFLNVSTESGKRANVGDKCCSWTHPNSPLPSSGLLKPGTFQCKDYMPGDLPTDPF